MSTQLSLWGTEPSDPEIGVGRGAFRASLAREMRYLLTVSHYAGKRGQISPTGVAHSLGVCLIEDGLMARGQKGERKREAGNSMPRFVDVKLDPAQRDAFLAWYSPTRDQVETLQQLADAGYRVGVTWSGEHQSYTVSATCRDPASPNNGLCMTAFAGELERAIALLWFKHHHVAGERWFEVASVPTEDFG